MIRDTSTGFGLISILFHWLGAIVTLVVFGVGFYLTSYGYYSPNALKIAHFHYALGMLLLGLIVIRLLWRLTSKTPATLSSSLAMRITIKLSKLMLYVLLLIIMVTGYFICTSEGQTVDVFGLFQVPSVLLLDIEKLNLAGLSHKYLSWVLMGLVAVHAIAALVHHFVKKDRTLVRMIKPGKQS
ncbi:cytochrome b [Cellvibrio mixtus]|uniref:cytochrome b n=1 Tax=Cellvibrio mixtus TaxID=39650 RepID=UPI000586753A|nr:cytochrome b [Cellvibrio mixtus]